MPVSSTGAAASQNSIPQPSKNEKAAFCGVAAAIRQAIEGEEKGEWDLPDADASDEEMNDWIHKYHANTLPTEAVKAHIVVDEGLELPGLDHSDRLKRFRIKVVFDVDQPYLELEASFKQHVDPETTMVSRNLRSGAEAFTYMRVRFRPSDGGGLDLQRATSKDQIPSSLHEFEYIARAMGKGELYVMYIWCPPESLLEVGVHGAHDFVDSKSDQYAAIMAQIKDMFETQVIVKLPQANFAIAFYRFQFLMSTHYTESDLFWKHAIFPGSGGLDPSWGRAGISRRKDAFARVAKTTFDSIAQWQATMGIGALRARDHELCEVWKAASLAIPCSFAYPVESADSWPIPYRKHHRYVLGFGRCCEPRVLEMLLSPGSTGILLFEPHSDLKKRELHVQRKQAGYQMSIRGPPTQTGIPGSFRFSVWIPETDLGKFKISASSSAAMQASNFYIDPITIDPGAMRDMDLVNQIAWEPESSLAKVLLGNEHVAAEHWDPFEELGEHRLTRLMQGLIDNRSDIISAYRQLKSPLMLIHGPPGTGKTHLTVRLIRLHVEAGCRITIYAPTNSTADLLVTLLQKQNEENEDNNLAIVRLHALSMEMQRVQHQGMKQDSVCTADIDNLLEFEELHRHFKNLGAGAWVLRCLGQLDDQVHPGCFNFDPGTESIASALRDLMRSKTALDNSGRLLKGYVDQIKQIMHFVLQRANVIVTTTDKASDKLLVKARWPKVIIVDEASQITELNTIMGWVLNQDSVKRVILVGDHLQMSPKAVAKYQKDGQLANPFADQISLSFFERMMNTGHKLHLLNTNLRATAGLSRSYNEITYGCRLLDHKSVALKYRTGSQNALQYIAKVHKKHLEAPFLMFNVSGARSCVEAGSRSKYNLHFIAAGLQEIQNMLAEKLWKQSEITVITPYRMQSKVWEECLAAQGYGEIAVLTINEASGCENEMIILDTVLASSQVDDEALGFFNNPGRITMALSRARQHFLLIGDYEVGLLSESSQVKLASMTSKGQIATFKNRETHKKQWLFKMYDFHRKAGAMVSCEIEKSLEDLVRRQAFGV